MVGEAGRAAHGVLVQEGAELARAQQVGPREAAAQERRPTRADDGEDPPADEGVTARLTERLAADREPGPKLCQGTLLSRQQYLTDIVRWQYDDARLVQGHMAPEDIAHWTAAIEAPR